MISEKELNSIINLFITQVRRRQIRGRFNIGKQTALTIRELIGSTKKNDTVQDLINVIRKVGIMCTRALPTEMVIGNIVRRVLYIIRDEYKRYVYSRQQNLDESKILHQPNLTSLLEGGEEIDFCKPVTDVKANIIEEVNELIDELDDIVNDIAAQATEHIHANEVILTFGQSHTVELFLQSARKKKKSGEKETSFQVVVAEAAPSFSGHLMAMNLAKAGISTTLTSECSVYAIMSRVNKVIVGCHAVLANGGILAPCGMLMIALAAKAHSVPFVVCTGLYKLTPAYPVDQDTFNNRFNPNEILSYEQASWMKNVHVLNPAYDYVPPELISLFITNVGTGTHSPSYIYRLLAEYYNPEDYVLEEVDENNEEKKKKVEQSNTEGDE